jgi:hypothetical protein
MIRYMIFERFEASEFAAGTTNTDKVSHGDIVEYSEINREFKVDSSGGQVIGNGMHLVLKI